MDELTAHDKPSQPNRQRLIWLIAAVVVLLVAFGLRMWHLGSESIWHDEAWSIRAIHGPFTTPDDNTPFLYYFSGHILWRLGGGDSPLALRYVSVLIGTLTAGAALSLGRRWVGWLPALAFGLMVAVSPLLWEYAQEVRAYVAVPLIALLLLDAADRLLTPPSVPLPESGEGAFFRTSGATPRSAVAALAGKVGRGSWLTILLVELAGLYTHNLSVALVIWLNVALGMAWLWRRDWRSIVTWGATQAVLVVLYIPWLLTQSPSGTPLNTPPQPGLGLVRDIWLSYFLPALAQWRDAVSGANAGLLPLLDVLGVVSLLLVMVAAVVWLRRPHSKPLPKALERGFNAITSAGGVTPPYPETSSPEPADSLDDTVNVAGADSPPSLSEAASSGKGVGRMGTQIRTDNLALADSSPSPFSGRGPGGGVLFPHRFWLLLTHALLVPAFSEAILLAANIDFHPRYFIAAVPGTLLLIVAALYHWTPPWMVNEDPLPTSPVNRGGVMLSYSQKSSPRAADSSDDTANVAGADSPPSLPLRGRGPGGWGLALLTAIVIYASIASLRDITSTRTYQHDDFAALAAYYDSLPPETAIIIPFDDEPALQYYFDRVLDIEAEFVNIPLHSDEATAIAALNQLAGRPVEFLTWFQLPADQRGMYSCLLAAASAQPETDDDARLYFGLMTQHYQLQPLTMQPIQASPVYREITLESAAFAPTPTGACLRTAWALNMSAPDDLRLAVTVLSPTGNEIGRGNFPIARPDNAGTSNWEPGDTGQAYALLGLPAGVPPGDYTAQLTVFSITRPVGLDVLDAAGNPAGKFYTLPQSITMQGPALSPDTAAPSLYWSAPPDALITGFPLDVTLVLPAGEGQVPITLSGDGWSLEQSAPLYETPTLSWHQFIVPPGNTGAAELRTGDVLLTTYSLADPERLLHDPELGERVGVSLPGVGTLVSAAINDALVSAASPPQVTLVWQAEGQIDRAYTVFMQLLSPDGQVIAQSDSQPAEDQRPTTTWIAGEYIIDTHTLRFNLPDYTGEVSVIAGMYDAAEGFRRVSSETGADAIALPFALQVQGNR